MPDMSSVSISIVTRTVWGNKNIVIADLTVGDGALTFPTAGVPLTPEDFGLETIDFVAFDNLSMDYVYNISSEVLDAYVPHDVPGAAVVRLDAAAAVPNETVRCLIIGTRE